MAVADRAQAAFERALRAKDAEINAHRRAIEVHEHTAKLYQDLGHHDEAEHERNLANRVRDRLEAAIREREEMHFPTDN
jgi:hypothetical protein